MLCLKELCRNIVVDYSAIVHDAESVLFTLTSTKSSLVYGDMASFILAAIIHMAELQIPFYHIIIILRS